MEWFRFYESTLDNVKAQALPGELFKGWVNLLCLANSGNGVLPSLRVIAFRLRLSEEDSKALLQRLVEEQLIDVRDGYLEMHDWAEFQRISDTSAERTRRYRERQAVKMITQAKGENGAKATVTSPTRHESRHSDGLETETETEEKIDKSISAAQAAPAPLESEAPSEKPDKAPSETQLQIQQTAETVANHLKVRHPEIRNGLSANAIKNKLYAIVRRHKVKARDTVEFLTGIDQRHERWCQSPQWLDKNGVYAKALANWLKAADDLYLNEPIATGKAIAAVNGASKPATSFPREIYGPEPEGTLTPERISELREQAEDPNPTIAAAARLMLSQMPLPEVSPWKN
jgi:hypothetical protein